jgi:hypothetical protein
MLFQHTESTSRRAALHGGGGIVVAVFLIWPGTLPAQPASAADPARSCRAAGNDDTLRPLPPSLVAKAKALFQLDMPDAQVVQGTVMRCADGKVLLCSAGANLPCGKANTSRKLAGAAAWCREHPGADFIPMSATGHDTIFPWRCTGAAPETFGDSERVDARGFVASYWKRAD